MFWKIMKSPIIHFLPLRKLNAYKKATFWQGIKLLETKKKKKKSNIPSAFLKFFTNFSLRYFLSNGVLQNFLRILFSSCFPFLHVYTPIHSFGSNSHLFSQDFHLYLSGLNSLSDRLILSLNFLLKFSTRKFQSHFKPTYPSDNSRL